MRGKQRLALLAVAMACSVALWVIAADQPAAKERRVTMRKTFQAGNYKDAYDGLRVLALDPANDGAEVGQDLDLAVTCLHNLGRVDEIDEFRETVIKAHPKNWRLLQSAALSYAKSEHFGYIVAGKFDRGHKRGGGRYVSAWERDRVRALQLMQQAVPLLARETDKPAIARFDLHFADLLLGVAGGRESWRMQYLTDLSQLPDYDDGYRYWGGQGGGAPVDGDGNPVLYRVPKSYDAAQSDGERWRWMLTQAAQIDSLRAGDVDLRLANFMRSQLGVQTMAGFGFGSDDGKEDRSGPYALHTLKDDETIARLATGIKRFKVPDEFNWIKIAERVAGRGKSGAGARARDLLAGEYEDRRQYVRAATAWKKAIEEYGAGHEKYREQRLEQIVGNWGRFEGGAPQSAGSKASIALRFRNGNKVSFEAHAINVRKLLDDVQTYIDGKPGTLDWQKMQIHDLGYRLVEQDHKAYLGDKVASWDVELKPRPGHVDDLATVTTPLQKPGAYLVTARMAGGNLSRIIVWVNDTVLLKKNLDGKSWYFVADAVSGAPVPGAELKFFGWRQVQVEPNKPNYRVETLRHAAVTDADGQVLSDDRTLPQGYQWLITARKTKDGFAGSDRFAYLGFTNVWYGQRYDADYNQTRVYTITDRPVYRPEQKVQFKAWVRHAKYDQADTSTFANKRFVVKIFNARGDKVSEQSFTTDKWGGLSGELNLAKGATLGVYQIQVGDLGGGQFRVEEYKKPEFEVQVEAPKEPVALGETIAATVKAKYYFGAPVTKAKVKIKVTRSGYSTAWYPRGSWDWLYGAGYWWFAGDYPWYPGWNEWGCKRPVPAWWGGHGEQPEVVLETEGEIGADGIVKVSIDTAPAKVLHGNHDHQYSVTAEVVDESRRTIVGSGIVLAARKPFKVLSWVDRGHYWAGDTVTASFRAQTLDGKPVEGKGELTLYRITYNDDAKPIEKAVETWKLDTNAQGEAHHKLKATEAGQYRLSLKLTDTKKHTIEGGYLFVVRGAGFDGKGYRFNDLELVTDKREYAPGDKVKLLVNTDQQDGVVLLFVRPTNGIYLAPKVLRLKGKSVEEEIAVVQKDMPNFFVEAVTVAGGRVHSEVREVVVPPEKRVLNVEVLPSATEYKPGQKATVKVKLTDFFGKPFVGSLALSVYDRSVEYISGGSNVPEIRAFFWSWRRQHYPHTESSLERWIGNLLRHNEIAMSNLGVFGERVLDGLASQPMGGKGADKKEGKPGATRASLNEKEKEATGTPDAPAKGEPGRGDGVPVEGLAGPPGGLEPTVRKNFADTAYWTPSVTTDRDGVAEVTFSMPENLTGWKVKAWGMGHGTKVGQGEADVVTKKDLLVRLQAPRFFVQKDEVVLSANVHNYLKAEKAVKVTLEVEGGTLTLTGESDREVRIPAGGEKRVDWRVKVQQEGQAIVRVKAVSDEETDAMQMPLPCYVHGMLKMESFSGVVRGDKTSAQVTLTVPAERRINETRLEVRYTPTLAGAMVDALPYMVEYPYGCTEQTLNRFVPTVITQRVLQRMKLDLKEIEKKRTNLNSQEIGDDKERAKGWKRFDRNPVFDEDEVKRMAAAGVGALAGMQVSDGGWGWFSGFGEQSWPHTTAVVVHGLQVARVNDVSLPAGMLERGVDWLKNYQAAQVQLIQNAPSKTKPYKEHADNLDALVYQVLLDADVKSPEMRDFLYRDRTKLSVYAKALFGLALHHEQDAGKLREVLKNIEQYVVQDNENQTAYLRLPAEESWWHWYSSETEANACYLKLLARTNPKDETASRLVKYLLNNRKHATYWNSTRDTALCVEAMAEYLQGSGEDRPDLTIEVWLDGKKRKEVSVDNKTLFTFDNKFVLLGEAIDSGKHTLEIRRKGTGPVYFNAYLTNFTLEDPIKRAGLEVKVNRKYYKLTRDDKEVKVEGSRGQAIGQKVERYKRTELENLATLKSGDLVEVELEIDSKNDYEYLLFEDPKAAGFEAMLVRSGYNGNDLGAYMELRDDRVSFFVRQLARGKHSVSYRLRAEVPGKFSALPAKASAMYAPELRGNSDEMKLAIVD
jgi:uncharacterized protein YfaS (alpha-2-macroglobulin family)